jgi:tRNA modification GTPase
VSEAAIVETMAAIATAPGRGGIGILRLSGPAAFDIAARLCGPLPEARRVALRTFRDADGTPCDRGLVLRFEQEASYTGERMVELHAHGSPALLSMLLQAACTHGARIARPGEFTERAFLAGRLDLAQAEAVADLIEAGSRAAVQAAHRTIEGAFSALVHDLAARLLDLRVFVEGALDFSDEDVDWLSDAQLAQGLDEAERHLRDVIARAGQGRRLRDGMVVAIAGRPNVGKSTLLNALSGTDAAIVSQIPGTTRDVLREHLDLDGLPLTLVDTAGLRPTDDAIETEGIRRAWQALSRAELALFVVDDAAGVTEADRDLLARLPEGLAHVLVFNKCDLTGAGAGAVRFEDRPAVRVCASGGAGLDTLRATIREHAGLDAQTEGSFTARARHLEALSLAHRHLVEARLALATAGAAEIAAEELRRAHEALGRVTGEVTTEDLLGVVFSRFCIGK